MYKALFYKEWIKIRWALLGYLSVVVLDLLYIGLNLRYEFEVASAIRRWLVTINYQIQYFSPIIFKYLPVIGGLAIGILQFVPEAVKNRFRLSFHLPIEEKKMLLFEILIGIVFILAIYLIIIIGLLIIGNTFFPVELTRAAILTSLPWLLAGIIVYMATAMITSEPSWNKKIILMILTFFTLALYFQGRNFNQYNHCIIQYTILMLLFTITILFPGYRLRKGSK